MVHSAKLLVPFLIGVLLVPLLFVQSARAYIPTGQRWCSGISSMKYYQDSMDVGSATAFQDARNSWNATPTPFEMITRVTNQNDYWNVRFHVRAAQDGLDGLAIWCYNTQTNCLNYTRIYLNTLYTQGYTRNARRSVTAHELGHILGLADLPYGAIDLMNDSTGDRYDYYGIYEPTTNEVDGVNAIY